MTLFPHLNLWMEVCQAVRGNYQVCRIHIGPDAHGQHLAVLANIYLHSLENNICKERQYHLTRKCIIFHMWLNKLSKLVGSDSIYFAIDIDELKGHPHWWQTLARANSTNLQNTPPCQTFEFELFFKQCILALQCIAAIFFEVGIYNVLVWVQFCVNFSIQELQKINFNIP